MANTATSRNPNEFLQFPFSDNELIPGLPDDLAMECLLRVPITSHPTLRLVSHQWKSTISNPSFFSLRCRTNFAENLIFLIQPLSPPSPPPPTEKVVECGEEESNLMEVDKQPIHGGPLRYNLNIYNTQNDEWRCLAGLTIPAFSQCVVLPAIGKLVVLGGWDPTTLEPVSRVLVLDLALGTWKEGSPMPTARSFFAATAAAPAMVYVAGGHDGQKNALRSAEAYDVAADEWRKLPSMAEERDESYGLSFSDDGKFWVISGYGTESQGRFRPDAEVFDPEMGAWSTVTGVWPHPGKNPKSTAVVTVEGRRRWWHVVEGEIKEYEWEEKEWKGLNLGMIPKGVSGLWSSSSWVSLVDVGNGKIFVMGNGENSGGEGMFVLERENEEKIQKNNKGGALNWRWQHVDAPSSFLGFPFSATHILI